LNLNDAYLNNALLIEYQIYLNITIITLFQLIFKDICLNLKIRADWLKIIKLEFGRENLELK